jgi:hypothetical protein
LPLLDELRKHSSTTRALTRLVEKRSGVVGAAGRAAVGVAKRVGATALAHPLPTAVGVLGTAAAIGQAKRTMSGFNPAVHRAQLGIEQ